MRISAFVFSCAMIGTPTGNAGRPATWSGSAWLTTIATMGFEVTFAISAITSFAFSLALCVSKTTTPVSPTMNPLRDMPPSTWYTPSLTRCDVSTSGPAGCCAVAGNMIAAMARTNARMRFGSFMVFI